MRTTAIVLAGGKGTRMNTEVPKQYIAIEGRPILSYTIEAFQNSRVDDIIVVTGDSYIDGEEEMTYCRQFVKQYGFDKVKMYVTGGKERYNSVMNGLDVTADADVVLVHDGARPCITPELINTCIEDTLKYGSSVLAVPVKDTIKVVDKDLNVVDTPDRSTLWQIQTPQCFICDELKTAYKILKDSDNVAYNITDDAMVMEKLYGMKVHITSSEYTNIKVTTKEDLEILKVFFKKVLTKK